MSIGKVYIGFSKLKVIRTASHHKRQQVGQPLKLLKRREKPEKSESKMLNRGVKRKFLTLKEKVEVIEFARKHPFIGSRDLGAKFSCGKTQINSTLATNSFLLERGASNDGGNMERKHGRSEQQYGEINNLL